MAETFTVCEDNRATVICPRCKNASVHDVSRFMGIDTFIKLKTKCRECSHPFSFNLQRRKYFRKDVNLPGICIFGSGQARISVTVVDISQGGLKLEMDRYHDFKPGEEVGIEFQLDDRHATLIRRDIVVTSVRDMFLNGRFNSSEHYDKLGPYILFG